MKELFERAASPKGNSETTPNFSVIFSAIYWEAEAPAQWENKTVGPTFSHFEGAV